MEINPFLQEKSKLPKKKKSYKTSCHGNVNIDEHLTTTLKYSQIILKRNHQDLVVIHVANKRFWSYSFFSGLSPSLNRVNTAAWVIIFTNINVMIFFRNCIRLRYMTFWRDGNQFLMSFYEKARRAQTSAPLNYLNVLVLYSVLYSITWGSFYWFGLVLALYFLAFQNVSDVIKSVLIGNIFCILHAQ